MSYQGHCNCESIRITLPQKPPNTVVCHCDCCKRAGGSAFSVNYFIDEAGVTVEDTNSTLKVYDDKNSFSGNIAKRHFCSGCGSPIYTKTPMAPEKMFMKASLFDNVSPPTTEIFTNRQHTWVNIGHATEKHA